MAAWPGELCVAQDTQAALRASPPLSCSLYELAGDCYED